MKSFKQHIVEFDNPQIYCDMDGVVADFLKFTRNILGTKFRDKFWEDIPEDTFAQLDKMPDADMLWKYIKQFRPIMLTASPRESRGLIAKRAPQDKIRWMKKNFGLNKLKTKTIKTNRLDKILKKFDIKHIDFLNIDIEGLELEVMSTINLKKLNIALRRRLQKLEELRKYTENRQAQLKSRNLIFRSPL